MRARLLRRLRVMALGPACLAGAAREALSQDVPTVFAHGVAADSTSWMYAAGYLSGLLRITPVTKTTPFHKSEQDQALQLAARLNADPRTSAMSLRLPFVAHSNGGLVSRRFSIDDPRLQKLVTVASPHQGSMLANNWLNYEVYNYGSYAVTSLFSPIDFYVRNDPAVPTAVSVIATPIFNLLGGIFNALDQLMCPIAGMCVGIDGISGAVPVVYDLRLLGSPLIAELNSQGNLNREASAIQERVGLYTTIDPVNGFFHLTFPGDVNTLASARDLAIASYLSLWSHYEFHADYTLRANRQLWLNGAVAMMDVDANWYDLIGSLISHTRVYNPASGYWKTDTELYANDGLIDHRSAGYPGSTLTQQIQGNLAHSEQTASPAVALKLYDILVDRFGILRRDAPPPPPPYWPVQINGTTSVRPGDSCYWYASSGIADASFEWSVNGTPLGSAQDFWYSGSSSFTLSVNVWNAAAHGGSASVTVNVSSANGQCYVE